VRHLRRRRALSGARAAFAVTALLPLAACGSEGDWRRLEERWVEQAGYHPLERYPPRQANASARRIEELVAPMGVRLAPSESEGRPEPDPRAVERGSQLHSAIVVHLRDETSKGPAALPEEVRRGLDERDAALREVRSILLSDELPRWELDLGTGFGVPQPNLAGHLKLHLLLLAAAWRSALSDTTESELWLEAASRLQRGLAEDPLLVPQLLANSEMRTMQRVLRDLPYLPEGWRGLLPVDRLRDRAFEALRVESWLFIRTGRRLGAETAGNETWSSGFFSYQGARGATIAIDSAIEKLRRADLRLYDSERFVREITEEIPRWNIIASMTLSNSLGVPVKAARCDLDLELTRRALELRELLQAGERRTTELEGSRGSIVAPGIVWTSSVDAGSVLVRAVGGEIPTEDRSPLPLELRVPIPSLK
jgi:hypothetical protein